MKLLAGPWIGEFGWEVMAWQGYLRAIAPGYTHVTVAAPPGHESMYEFADKFIPIASSTLKANMWMNQAERYKALDTFKFLTGQVELSDYEVADPEILWYNLVELHKGILVTAIKPQQFIKFGTKGDGYDILIHARNRDDWDSGFRNWHPEHAEIVLRSFDNLEVASIGLPDMSFHIPGTVDLRGIPLADLANVMASSRVLVGPISGPVHFGALCSIPTVTWATKKEHEERVTKKWNPFDCQVEVITGDDEIWKNRTPWTPRPREIIAKIRKVIT